MRIEKELIPFLTASVEKYIDLDQNWLEDDGEAHENDIDPNDWMIFHLFVLPVLQDHAETGFDSEQMLDKGFSFMMHLIPYFLRSSEALVDPLLEGKLLKIYLEYAVAGVLGDVKRLPAEYFKENLGQIFERFDHIQRSLAS